MYDDTVMVDKAYYNKLKEQTTWVSVKDRLPEPMKAVLIISKSTGIPFFDGIAIDWVRDGKFTRFKKVTHWMPLPELPKENDAK